jgi:hypothetical protein
MTPPSSIIVSPGAGIPPTTSASDPFETIASNSFALLWIPTKVTP